MLCWLCVSVCVCLVVCGVDWLSVRLVGRLVVWLFGSGFVVLLSVCVVGVVVFVVVLFCCFGFVLCCCVVVQLFCCGGALLCCCAVVMSFWCFVVL